MIIREFKIKDIPQMIDIWNDVVRDGVAFPQDEELTISSGEEFFKGQTYSGVCEDDNGEIVGLYILHPNNVGRCSHIANSSYAVDKNFQNKHIGKSLVEDSLKIAKEKGFRILQFNAVVKSNKSALHLYEKLGFIRLGEIPGGFLDRNGNYQDIIPHYRLL